MIRLIPQKPKGQKQFLQIIADMEKLKYDFGFKNKTEVTSVKLELRKCY